MQGFGRVPEMFLSENSTTGVGSEQLFYCTPSGCGDKSWGSPTGGVAYGRLCRRLYSVNPSGFTAAFYTLLRVPCKDFHAHRVAVSPRPRVASFRCGRAALFAAL